MRAHRGHDQRSPLYDRCVTTPAGHQHKPRYGHRVDNVGRMSAGRRLVADVAYLDGVAQRLASHSLHTAVARTYGRSSCPDDSTMEAAEGPDQVG
jgi:hypothetical protein